MAFWKEITMEHMTVYLLTRKGSKPTPTHSVGRTVPVLVEGTNWYRARAQAIQHAINEGARTMAVMCEDVTIYRRPWGHKVAPASVFDHRGMWLYANRLACRYGHVYVPPMGWERKHPQCGTVLTPTIPLVSVYQVKALQSLDDYGQHLGLNLCKNGYDSYCLGDYYHRSGIYPHDLRLEESGSTTSWTKAYIGAIAGLLEEA